MAWIRDGVPPDQIKVSFLVSAKEYPELAQFILSLPYRGTSKILREMLSSAVKSASTGAALTSGPVPPQASAMNAPAQSHEIHQDQGGLAATPGVGVVSAAAVGIIESFDRMFPPAGDET